MFRFTIRELVLLTVMVAIGVGWWMEHRSQLERLDDTAGVLDETVGVLREEQWRFETLAKLIEHDGYTVNRTPTWQVLVTEPCIAIV